MIKIITVGSIKEKYFKRCDRRISKAIKKIYRPRNSRNKR